MFVCQALYAHTLAAVQYYLLDIDFSYLKFFPQIMNVDYCLVAQLRSKPYVVIVDDYALKIKAQTSILSIVDCSHN